MHPETGISWKSSDTLDWAKYPSSLLFPEFRGLDGRWVGTRRSVGPEVKAARSVGGSSWRENGASRKKTTEDGVKRNRGEKKERETAREGPALRQLMNHLGTDPRSPVGRDGAMQSPAANNDGGDDDVGVVVGGLRRLFALIIQSATLPISLRCSYPRILLHRSTNSPLIPLKRPRFPSDSYLNSPLLVGQTDQVAATFPSFWSRVWPEKQEAGKEVGQRGETNLPMRERRVEGGARSFT